MGAPGKGLSPFLWNGFFSLDVLSDVHFDELSKRNAVVSQDVLLRPSSDIRRYVLKRFFLCH